MITTEQYWLAQDPVVRILHDLWVNGNSEQAIREAAQQLAEKGYIIDELIMVGGCVPDVAMEVRQNHGYKWVPNAMQPHASWQAMQDAAQMPPGAIKVSRDPADYPQFVIPADPSWPADPIGWPYIAGELYWPKEGDTRPVGEHYKDSRGEFVKVAKQVMFGQSVLWEKQKD